MDIDYYGNFSGTLNFYGRSNRITSCYSNCSLEVKACHRPTIGRLTKLNAYFVAIANRKNNLLIYFRAYILMLMEIEKSYRLIFIFQVNASNSCCKTQGTNCFTQIILIWADMDKHQCFRITSCQCEKTKVS
jgi:hypothetical protein